VRRLSTTIQQRMSSISTQNAGGPRKSPAAGSVALEIARARPQRLETGVTLEQG
jgi:hypothetical protein